MRALIIDDDPMAIESMRFLLSKFERIESIEAFESPIHAMKYLKSNAVDVIFLDVEMPDMSGLDFLEISSNLPSIILTTSKKEYALEAFEYDVTDYLTKPVNLKRLNKALERITEKVEEDESNHEEKTSLFIKSDGRYIRIELASLEYIQAMDDYIQFVLGDGSKHLVHSTMKAIEQDLPSKTFLRVHRSYIVNQEKIVDFEDSSLVIGKKVIPVSKSHREELFRRMGIK